MTHSDVPPVQFTSQSADEGAVPAPTDAADRLASMPRLRHPFDPATPSPATGPSQGRTN